MEYLEINKKINIRISLSEYLGEKNKQKTNKIYVLTSEIPGTLLDLGCQFQWSLGVWYNTLYSAEDLDINATVAKTADQKYHLQTIRKVWSFLKQNFELDSTMAIKRYDPHGFPWFLSLKLLDKILFKPHHIIFKMYTIMSETFVKIDSLQHLEISWET